MMRGTLPAFLLLLFYLLVPEAAQAEKGLELSLVRDKQSHSAVMRILHAGPWELFAGSGPDDIDYSAPLLSGIGDGNHILPVNTALRMYCVLKTTDTSVAFAENLLPMQGAWNVRDLGGMTTTDGRTVAYGKLLRSDDMSGLTDDDLRYLASVPLVTVVDFRAESEAARKPDRLPDSVQRRLHLPMDPGRLDMPSKEDGRATAEDWADFMRKVNRALVLDEENIRYYREFFQILQQDTALPLLFHCSAGKDRTGLAAAMILISLGVERDAVMRDYMASAPALRGKYKHLVERHPERLPLFTVYEDYLEAALAAMEEKSGGAEQYIEEVLGVDRQRMRALFLQ